LQSRRNQETFVFPRRRDQPKTPEQLFEKVAKPVRGSGMAPGTPVWGGVFPARPLG